MKTQWIIKPNKWYDGLEEPTKLLSMLAVMILPYLVLNIFMKEELAWLITMLIFGLIGIYRIICHMIMDYIETINKSV